MRQAVYDAALEMMCYRMIMIDVLSVYHKIIEEKRSRDEFEPAEY